jgi:hypothetical protein
MSEYFPDNWVVVFLNGDDPHHRILAGWSGGYLHGDSWRMNSGIVRVERDGDCYRFYGSSGSCYVCHEDFYGLRKNNSYVWKQLEDIHGDKVSLLNENTNWLEMEWSKS